MAFSEELMAFYTRHRVRLGETPEDCCVWTKGTGTNGPDIQKQKEYGRVWHRGKVVNVQRAAYEIERANVKPEWILVRDVSICEQELCCNPKHWLAMPRKELPRHLSRTGQWSRATHSTPATIAAARSRAKINMEIAREVRQSEETGAALARRLGLCQSTISAIRRGQIWRDSSNPFAGIL